jgi:hypothetical protein
MGHRHYERAEQALEDDLNAGRISQTDFNAEVKQLVRDEREEMEEAAYQAAKDVRENW